MKESKNLKIWPCWRDTKEHLFSLDDFTSSFVKWAVKQSPYAYPETLIEAINDLRGRLQEDFEFCSLGYTHASCKYIYDYLSGVFEKIESIRVMNDSKEGDHNHVHTTSYSKPLPDCDFIDLSALARNISHDMIIERHYWD